MSTPQTTGAQLTAVLPAVLATGGREAFEALLTPDVHWHDGTDCGDGQHCHTRSEAGHFYATLLATGLTLTVARITPNDPYLDVRLHLTWPVPDQDPVEQTARLRVRDGLIAEITGLDPPPVLEVLYVDGCPHHDAFLPHLRQLLAEHQVGAPILSLIHI